MLLLISFVARYTEISMFLLNSSVFERNKEMSIFLLQKFPQFTLFFDSVFSFWQL